MQPLRFLWRFPSKFFDVFIKKTERGGLEFSSQKTELRGHDDVTFRVSNSEILIKIKFSS